jgi:hypothetical protein
MPSVLPQGKQYYETSAGVPLVGGKVYTYDAGTTNPRVTYQDAAGAQPNTNPVILDARGEAVIFWSGAYKVVLKDSLDVTIWTVDNVNSPLTSVDSSIIPGTDNLYDLGSVTKAWRQVYVGSGHAPIFDTTTGNLGYYRRTDIEIAAGVTPTNFSYAPYTRGRYSSWTAWRSACDQGGAEGILEGDYTITADILLPKRCDFKGFKIGGAFYSTHELYSGGYVKSWRADQPRIRGCYYCDYTDIDTGSIVNGTLTVTGGNGASNPGTFWCKIGIAAIVNLVIDASFFDVNQNLFTGGVARYVHLTGGAGGTGGIHANTFKCIDASNNSLPSSGFLQDDEKRYVNYIEGVYYEGGSDIQGNFHIVGFQGDASSPPRTDRFTNIINAVGINQKNTKDFPSISVRNLVRGGNWDWLDSTSKPVGFSTTSAAATAVNVDTTEPCGMGKRYEGTFSAAFSSFNITIQPTGSDRFGAVIYYKSTDSFVAITSDDGGGAQSINVAPVVVDATNNWKMLRLSGTASKTATTAVTLFAYTGVGGAAKVISLGGVFASAERMIVPPQKNDDYKFDIYTPTLTNVANVAAATANPCNYMRVTGGVMVSGVITVTPTAAGVSTGVGISLPVAPVTAFSAAGQCAGTACTGTIASEVASILTDTANNRAEMRWMTTSNVIHSMYFTFLYRL